jgi:hypothetical protein
MLEEGDTQQMKLAEAIRKRGSEDLQAMFKEYKGTPAQEAGIYNQSGQRTQATTSDMYDANLQLNPQYQQREAIAGQAPNPMAAVLRGSNSYNPMARQFAGTLLTEMTKPPEYRSQKAGDELIRIRPDGTPEVIYSRPEKPEWTASTQYIGGEEVQGWVDKNSPNPAATFIQGSVKPKFSPAEELRLIDEGIIRPPNAPVNPAPNNVNLSGMPSKEIIASLESGKAGYDAIFGFPSQGGDPSIVKKYGKPLSELTINEVLNEATPRMATNSGAVGRYQFLPSTLKGLLPSVGLTVNDKFSPENQEKLYTAFRQQNSQALKNAGVQPTELNLHLAHAVGAGNVPLLLNPANQNKIAADVLDLTPEGRRTNPQLKVPVNQYLARMGNFYGQGGQTSETPTPPSNLTPKQKREWIANYEKQRSEQEFNPKSLTEVQSKATSFGMRMIEANKVLSDLEKEGVIKPSAFRWMSDIPVIGGTLGAGVNSLIATDQQQQLLQAKRNFITAVLRKESGAVIGDNEFKIEDEKYFPQKGDGPNTIAQKARARELAIRTMKIEAGAGAKELDAFSKEVNSRRLKDEVPKGVTKEQWAVMTPEEKAAFQ